MTLLIEALSGVLDTFLLYLFASGFYSQYRSTKYKGHLYLLAGIFIIVISCIPLSGIIRIILSWNIISISTYAIFESTIHKALLTSTAFITLSVLVDVICEYPFYLSGIPRTRIGTLHIHHLCKANQPTAYSFYCHAVWQKRVTRYSIQRIASTHDLPTGQCIYLHCIIGISRNRIAFSFNIINTFYCRNSIHQYRILRIYANYSHKL